MRTVLLLVRLSDRERVNQRRSLLLIRDRTFQINILTNLPTNYSKKLQFLQYCKMSLTITSSMPPISSIPIRNYEKLRSHLHWVLSFLSNPVDSSKLNLHANLSEDDYLGFGSYRAYYFYITDKINSDIAQAASRRSSLKPPPDSVKVMECLQSPMWGSDHDTKIEFIVDILLRNSTTYHLHVVILEGSNGTDYCGRGRPRTYWVQNLT